MNELLREIIHKKDETAYLLSILYRPLLGAEHPESTHKVIFTVHLLVLRHRMAVGWRSGTDHVDCTTRNLNHWWDWPDKCESSPEMLLSHQ